MDSVKLKPDLPALQVPLKLALESLNSALSVLPDVMPVIRLPLCVKVVVKDFYLPLLLDSVFPLVLIIHSKMPRVRV